MCGIVGYIGAKNSIPILIEGLKRLEYRGYDSAGIGVITKDEKEPIAIKASLPKDDLWAVCESKLRAKH